MTEIAIALNRFGLGGRIDEPPPDHARRWLTGQFDRFEARPAAIAAAPQRQQVVTEMADYFEELRAQNQARRRAGGDASPAMPMPAMTESRPMAGQPRDGLEQQIAGLPENIRRFVRRQARDFYLNMVAARTNAALTAPAPFVERMCHFWANHFAVSADKLTVIGLAGLLEFDAIRPNVLGSFTDMLMAVERHPAMLLYLDQAQSIGPNSRAARLAARVRRGQQQRRGLNENLAREIMELHTLGVHGGYSQADVTEFARAMTGWTVSGLARGPARRFIGEAAAPGDFHFAEAIHEPGPRTILGRGYAQEGEAQARAVLDDLARHPATARHIATKLARHFAGDEPPAAMVQRIERAWLTGGGDLPAVYRAIIESPEAWAAAPAKFRTPWDWSLAAMRAVGTREVQPQPAAGLMTQLGQPVWRPGSPAGFDDIDASWAGPDALMRRVEAAERIAGRTGDRIDARRLGPRLLPGALSDMTAQAIARAESPGQGLALLLVAPEFLREMNMLDRRSFIGGAAAAGAVLVAAPHMAVAQAAIDRRFVFIIQRGAADGLGTLAPTGDPAFAGLRGAFAEDFANGARLGDYTLHPNLAETARLYEAREALFVHAVASPYRDRSHFDGQNVLETGGNAAYALRDGWMNRLLGLLPQQDKRAMAVSATVPMVLRGTQEVGSYAPSALPDASDDLMARVTAMYEGDAQLHGVWAQAVRTRAMAGDLAGDNGRNAAATGALAARLLTGGEGARVAVIETGGWDTHAGQRARLGLQLRGLDALIGALRTGLGADWANTLVLVATEFGRTAAPNGTGGTDHGTASLAMLLGGAVAGGRVVSDWPGLASGQLYEARDLRPTTDLDRLIASAVSAHYGLDPARAGQALFPNMATGRPIEGLIRA